jgi:hypothetical protein
VAAEVEGAEKEQPGSLDELFTLRPEAFDVLADEESEDEDEDDQKQTGKKKKKKKKFVEVEYDPDHDVTLVKRHRKRGGGWEDDWNL